MDTPEEIARAASQPGTFSFVDRLKGRKYPTEDIVVYIDEALGYEIVKLERKINSTKSDAAVKKLTDQADELRKRLEPDSYTIKLRAISSEEYDKLVDEANETFPIEYNEFDSPLTGRKTKEEKPSEERQELFTALLWNAFIEDIVAPDGSTNGKPSVEDIPAIRMNMPLEAVGKVGNTINNLRMAVEWMDGIQDEAFFRTP